MKNKKSLYWLLAMLLGLSLVVAACGGDEASDTDETDNTTDNTEQNDSTDTNDTSNDSDENQSDSNEPKKGGTMVFGVDSEPEGLFNWAFYGIVTDADIISLFDEGLIEYDENLKPQPNLATWETEDNKTFTFKFKEGVKWHNGDELTVHDWVFALETIAHPDYDGPRYANVQTIEGAEAYRNGEADSISGVEVIDDYTIKITFDKARVNNLTNLWTYPMNRTAFEGIPVAEMSGSDPVRRNPVGLGPYKVENIIPGESVELVPFEDYWNGEPKLDKIIVKVVDRSSVLGALENGEIDFITVHPSMGPQVEKMNNADLVTYPGLAYYYVGFKLGKFDNESLEIVEKYDKYANKNLRKAMYYAIDRETWIDAFFSGYGKPVNRPVPSAHWIAADNSELNTYPYDPEKAKQLLDEAGYVDVNGDGWREDPNGDEFVVKFSHYDVGDPQYEARAKALTQYWNDIGLKTELDMVEVNLYYEMIEKDNPEIEVFYGGWGTGADPDPSALWKSDALWNYTRYDNPESDQLLDDALDIDIVGTSDEKRKDLYVEWQKIVNEDLPMLYITELEETVAVSKRMGGMEFDVSGWNNPVEWYIAE